MMKVSVIIPIYKVELFIERCVVSLMEQTLDDVEYIFVDDASPDGSVNILREVVERYSLRKDCVKIINHSENKGLPAARNTGLAEATGEYIFHCDSDDFVELDMLESLYNKAKECDADVVWCDYYITFDKKRRIIAQPQFETPQDAVRGMLRGKMKYNVWNKLVKRLLYVDNKITFPEGKSMGEDLTMIMAFLHAKKCAYVNKPLYNYVQNPNQMTATYNEEKLESLKYNCNRISQYIENKFGDADYRNEYSALKQLMKWPFLLDGKYSSYKRWHKWFPESNAFIWQTKGVNTRIKIIEWCASKHLWPIIWIHYIVVIKWFYGIMYR